MKTASPILVLLLLGCHGPTALQARGVVGGQPVASTVDAPVARYLLEVYDTPPGPEHDAGLDQEIAGLLAEADTGVDREWLADVAKRYSMDFAALIFARHIEKQGRNAHAQRLFNEMSTVDATGAHLKFPYVVVFAPGWFYASHPEYGGDYASSRKLLDTMGVENVLVRYEENGAIEDNAEQLRLAIREVAAQGKQMVLVSASKAGPEVALALGDPENNAAASVVGWLNIGGVLKGSPLADELYGSASCGLVKTALWFQGFGMEGVESLQTTRRRATYARLQFPAHVSIVNYVPWPLSGQITDPGRSTYADLRRYGPSDGVTLLADAIVEHAHTVIAPGVDHYLRDGAVEDRTMALLLAMRQLINERSTFSQVTQLR